MDMNFFQKLDRIEASLNALERRLDHLEKKLDAAIELNRGYMVKIKNNMYLSDSAILFGMSYCDLSPEMAWDFFNNSDRDFDVLDVSRLGHEVPARIAHSIHIPAENLHDRINEVRSRTRPLLVISENGVNSIKACELLARKGYLNVYNVSGGHEFWPGHKILDKKAA
jgi:rhodanese-related sulfurtransferase